MTLDRHVDSAADAADQLRVVDGRQRVNPLR
jgi:hypothetical protein